MACADLGDVRLFFRIDGDPDGLPVLFLHALGTDHRLWDEIIGKMPPGLALIRWDMRGHGQSDVPQGPYSMGTLVRDAERLMDHLHLRRAVVVGLSIGGMIAQGLAVKRLDLVRALVLSNTAAKIATPEIWNDRIAQVRAGGTAAVADATFARWFRAGTGALPAPQRMLAILRDTSSRGWTACAAAIAGTDFYTPTSGLRLPVLGIAGSHDGSTPPDLVRETVGLVPGSRFVLMQGAGHLPCVDQPDAYVTAVSDFLTAIGHAGPAENTDVE
jgi:3-oxoadipate enol-lactonase